jgi:hypothetical protein
MIAINKRSQTALPGVARILGEKPVADWAKESCGPGRVFCMTDGRVRTL